MQLWDWLVGQQVTAVGMEATSDYWKPVYDLLEDALEVQLLNAAHMRNLPGRKTDVSDAGWIAGLMRRAGSGSPIRRAQRPSRSRRAGAAQPVRAN